MSSLPSLVAVGSGDNTIAYSNDGSVWTAASNPLNAEVRTVVWNGSMWVAGGYNVNATFSIATSDDGITWTGRSTPLNGGNPYGGVYGVASSGSLWAAVGYGPKIITSSDAITWTERQNVFDGGNGQAIAYNGWRWVAVGSANGTGRIATSDDGISWTTRTNPFGSVNGNVFNVAWNGSMWVAVGSLYGTETTIATSPDGYNWIVRANPLTEQVHGIAWNGSVWMASGSNPQRTITHATSPDGITWTAAGNAFPGGQARGVAWSGSLWASVGHNSDLTQSIATSSDGMTWNLKPDLFYVGNKVASTFIYTPPTLAVTEAFSVAAGYGTGVAGENTLAYSYDGITWFARTNPLGTANAVAWNGSIWLAGGSSSSDIDMATSTDGINWTARTSPLGVTNAVAWNGSYWIAVGSGTIPVVKSSDAITWTAANHNPLGNGGELLGIAWNGWRWVAVGTNGSQNYTPRIATSEDGINWTARTDPFTRGVVSDIAWNGTLWVAVGNSYESSTRIATSPDGYNWTARTSPLNEQVNGITWNGSLWVAVGSNSNRNISVATSTDGITWTASGNVFPGGAGRGITWNGSLWIIVGHNQNITESIATSPDAVTWTMRTDMFYNGYDVASRKLVFNEPTLPPVTDAFSVAAGYGTGIAGENTLAYSYDGIRWFARTNPLDSAHAVAWNGSIWLAGGRRVGSDIDMATSTDGITWTGRSSPLYETKGVAWNGSYWIAVGSGTIPVVKSSDAITWTAANHNPLGNGGELFGIAWNGWRWVAVGTNSSQNYTPRIATSEDGINWTSRTDPFTRGVISDVAWNGSMWVAVGNAYESSTRIATSYDGVTWTARTNPLTEQVNGITWNGSIWVAVGSNSNRNISVATSTDGITWTASGNVFPGGAGRGITWNGSLWIIVGHNQNITESIATSPDAVTWTMRTDMFYNGYDVASLFMNTPPTLPAVTDAFCVAGSRSTNQLSHSYDGLKWIASRSPLDAEVRTVAYNGSLWVAGGYNVSATFSIATSPDGINWTGRATPLNGGNPYGGVYGVCWNGAVWTAVGFGGKAIIQSNDGITWTAVENNPFGAGGQGLAVASNGSFLVAVGTNSDYSVRIVTSTDGANWTVRNDPFTRGFVKGVIWNGDMWVAVGHAFNAPTTIATSYDGITWTARTNPLIHANGIAWNGSILAVSGHNSGNTVTIVTSNDGITWEPSANPFPGGVANAIGWNGSRWIATGRNADSTITLSTSSDALTWAPGPNIFANSEGQAISSRRPLDPPLRLILATPTALSATVTANSFTVSWTGGPGITSYTYLLNGASFTPIDNGLQNQSATFTGLSPSVTYTCTVIASNTFVTASSDALSVTTAALPPPPTPEVITQLSTSLTNANIATPAAATSAITDALATNSLATVVSAALSVESPALFTALVNNPNLVGTSLEIPSATAVSLYDSATSSEAINRALPLVVTIPAADGSVVAPALVNNTRMAIDVSVSDFTPFAGATGYGVRVVNGIQYFVTPTNTNGVAINAGSLMTFTTNDGVTREFTVADLDLLLTPYNLTAEVVTQLATSLTNANIATPAAATSAITDALATNSVAAVVSAALSVESPALFTALVNNPSLLGTSVEVQAATAVTLYDSATNSAAINRLLPLVVTIPAADGSVVAPALVNNTRMAIDVSVSDFTPFAGATGYGVRVVDGIQYFVTPTNTNGVPINAGSVMRFVTNAGVTREFTVADLDLLLTPYNLTAQAVTQLATSLTNANISTPAAATSAITNALATNSAAAVVSATMSLESPALFTALVNNSSLVGTTVQVPSVAAAAFYNSATNNAAINRSLPLVVSIPANGSLPAPLSGNNTRLAIDVSVPGLRMFTGATGYGVRVVNGIQYFVKPGNADVAITAGSVISIVTNTGATLTFMVADLDLLLVPYNGPPVVCFLGSAPVLTLTGYKRIDRIQVGEIIRTPTGTAKVEAIKKQVCKPSSYTNPYVIPEGKFGANRKVLISPRHKVSVDGEMIEAKDLGLEQEAQKGEFTYYNLQITKGENMIVGGVEVESLAPLVNVKISQAAFNQILAARYGGKLTDEIKAKCRFLSDGVIVPLIRR